MTHTQSILNIQECTDVSCENVRCAVLVCNSVCVDDTLCCAKGDKYIALLSPVGVVMVMMN